MGGSSGSKSSRPRANMLPSASNGASGPSGPAPPPHAPTPHANKGKEKLDSLEKLNSALGLEMEEY